MSLPIFKSDSQEMDLMQTSWASKINPVLNFPVNSGLLLKSQSLANGTTVINHRLGRKMQGWMITDINGAAAIYRSQPLNNLTLTLTSNAAVMVDLLVF